MSQHISNIYILDLLDPFSEKKQEVAVYAICIYVTLAKVYHPPKKKRKKEALSLTLETMTPQKEANTRSAASVFVPDAPAPSLGDPAKLLPPKDC